MNQMIKAAVAAASMLMTLSGTAFAAESFTLASESFADNEIMLRKYAAKGGPRKCDGENISPAMSWKNAPSGTKSFAIVAHDQVGEYGQGVDHWVLYDIPGDSAGFAEGQIPAAARVGPNITGAMGYLGPCPDVGDMPHHYEFMIVALDIEPGTLPDGLTLTGLLTAIKGHGLAATSIVGRYERKK